MNLPEIEQRILQFWKNFRIFEKSLYQNLRSKRFNWVEGPPYANAPPHMGHFLTRIYKDSILRFFTMLGFYAPRRAGWDTHGLPIEVATEKELGFKNKKEILDYGIEKFNQKCKELVTAFKDTWEKVDERLGFWIDHKNAYVTFDPFYIESCWWIIKQIYNQGLLKQEYRVAPYCPRCETVLAQAELGMPDAYKKVSDPSVFVKFKILNKDEYFLVWTTTPWTLPGNLALVVHPDFEYYLYRTDQGKIWSHSKLNFEIIKKVKGKELVGLKYEPLFKISNFKPSTNAYKVYSAEFVKEDEGTGIVHIAPAFGEEDFEIGQKNNLGIFNYLNEKGEFYNLEIEDLDLNGSFFKEADKKIIDYLKNKNLLFKAETYEHDYPHCWRCKTPLIYYATQFWVIKVSQVKDKIIENFKKTNWIPESAGHRFYEWIKEGKDWNLSRTRFWGIPLPIWKCSKCEKIEVVGSLQELAKHFKPNNRYYFMRHCESLSIKENFLSSYPEMRFNPLTRKGVSDALQKARGLKKTKIDLIYASPVLRAKETALIVAEELKIPVFFDERLREIDLGVLNGKPYEEFDKYICDSLTGKRDLNKKIENGESFQDVKKRALDLILELERKYRGKNILIVSHSGVLWILESALKGLSDNEIVDYKVKDYKLGEIRKIDVLVLPRDENNEINLHRPYVDNLTWQCSCGGWMKRIPEIADIWFDSGCVPFASYHYPFENKKEIDQKIIFPVDFIIEGIDQTRGWFYTLLVISTLIKNSPPYKNVLATGLVLDKFGKKMSKSLGNVVSPQEIIEKYGADPARFYLFYLNEVGENKSFNEEEIIQIKREFFDLLFNILRFYQFYYQQINKKLSRPSQNVLDLWFQARIKENYQDYYEAMLNFNLHKASRILFDLVSDFSRWWLRRSRKRFQNPKNKEELKEAIVSFENFYYQILKMLAPLAPFTAEYLYQEIKNELRERFPVKESIHLERLGKPLKLTLKEKLLLEEMKKIRNLASEVHRLRKERNIKVRQPLRFLSLKTKLSPEVLEVLKDEVNVLEIQIDPKQNEEILIDFEITTELKEIGIYNDFVRFIQDLRQDAGLTPKEIVSLKIEMSKMLAKILNKKLKQLKQETKTFAKKGKTILAEKEFDYENFGKVKIVLIK